MVSIVLYTYHLSHHHESKCAVLCWNIISARHFACAPADFFATFSLLTSFILFANANGYPTAVGTRGQSKKTWIHTRLSGYTSRLSRR
jgi:hypothetical protein